MATSYAGKNADKLQGIILLGSYPAADLSQSKLKLVSIYGDKDLILNREKLETTKEQAPPESFYYEMPGANHSGFGDYGQQEGDGVATLSREEQIGETIKVIREYLD